MHLKGMVVGAPELGLCYPRHNSANSEGHRQTADLKKKIRIGTRLA